MSKWLPWSSWTLVVPLISLVALALTWGVHIGPALGALEAVLLTGAVGAGGDHGEGGAARGGEPFGSLVLAAAVTVIEVALIVELMASGGNEAAPPGMYIAVAPLLSNNNGIC